MAIELTLKSGTDNKSATLLISGELDQIGIKEDYYRSLSAANKQSVQSLDELVVDLSKVKRADTSGLAWLLNLSRDIQANNTKVQFTHVPSKLLNLADLSNAKQFISAE